MICFNCDYTEGAHPKILEAMEKTNLEQTVGYGEDSYCQAAREKILEACQAPEAAVHFLVGGTQANFTVIRSILRPHQGALCSALGHINVHESGAIEATGHKVLLLPCGSDGKITASQIDAACAAHWNDETHEHQVQPGMVYLSHPTENGALYTKAELSAIHETCKKWNLPLYVDGARLGYGLTARNNDVTLPDLAACCDVFYIGGTKCGALFGEAVVITNPALNRDFRYFIKQGGGMLAKGRLLGLQFLTLFTDGLYQEICGRANQQAYRIAKACKDAGFPLLTESDTNQQFPIFPDSALEQLGKDFLYAFWEKVDETHSAVRLCTSWATKEEAVEKLISAISKLNP